MMTALTVWSTGLYIMWHKARHRLPLKNEPEVPRGWRAMAELSRTIERDLGSRGIDIATMEDWQVKREIRKQLRGGAISLDARLANSTYRTWPAFLTWVRKEKWWVLAWLCIIATSMLPFFLGGIHTCIVLWTVGGLFWAVVWLGNTGGSRAFMLAVAALVSITISTAVWGT